MKTKLLLLLLMATVFTGQDVFGQQLMTTPGTIDSRLSLAGTGYNGVYDVDGEVKATSKALHSQFNAHFTFGLHEKWSVLLNAPIAVYNRFNASEKDPGGLSEDKSQFYPGDLETGIRYGIKPEDNFSAAFTFIQSFATSERQVQIGLNTGFADNSSTLQFHIRYSKNPSFIFQTYMGFVNRNKGFSDEFHAGIYGWYVASSRWKIEAFIAGIQPIEEPADNINVYQHGLYHNYSGVLNSGGKIYLTSGNVQSYVGYHHPIRGQFIYASGTVTAGIIFKINCCKRVQKVEEKKDDSKNVE